MLHNNVCHYWSCDCSSVQFWVYQRGGRGWGCDVIFNITEGGLELFFLFWRGVLSKFLLDNSSFSAPPPLLIIITQSLNSGAHSFRILGSQKMPFFFNFPVSPALPEKIVWFLLAATSNHVQVRLDCTSGIKICVSKGGKSELTDFLIYRQKASKCLEFITYEVVARSVASQLKKNSPLAKKLLRSTCMQQYVTCLSKSLKKMLLNREAGTRWCSKVLSREFTCNIVLDY